MCCPSPDWNNTVASFLLVRHDFYVIFVSFLHFGWWTCNDSVHSPQASQHPVYPGRYTWGWGKACDHMTEQSLLATRRWNLPTRCHYWSALLSCCDWPSMMMAYKGKGGKFYLFLLVMFLALTVKYLIKIYPFGQDILHTVYFGVQFWLWFSLCFT